MPEEALAVAACSAVDKRETKIALTPPGKPDTMYQSVSRICALATHTCDDYRKQRKAAIPLHERIQDNSSASTDDHSDEEG